MPASRSWRLRRAAAASEAARIAELDDDNARLMAKVEELQHDIFGLSSTLRDREREINDLQIQLRMVRDDAQREIDNARWRFLTRR